MTPFSSPTADAELLICGKCHPECAECFDFSRYACSKCPSGMFLYMSTCILACPIGYIDDGTGACKPADCPAYYYRVPIPPGPATFFCAKMCALGTYADNSTWTCPSCHTDCEDCWGPLNTNCRTCSATTKLPLGDGTCITCPSSTYMDNYSAFVCAPAKLYSYIDTVTFSTPITNPQLAGIIQKTSGGAVDSTWIINAAGFLPFKTPGNIVSIPIITYSDTKICYRYLIEFQLELRVTGTSLADVTWHNKKVYLYDSGVVNGTVLVNKWDFENNVVPATFKTSTVKKYNRFFSNTLNCTHNSLSLSMTSDYTDTNTILGVKNLRVYFYQCPLNCISCNSSTSCFRCVEGKFFYALPNECQVPYTSLLMDQTGVVQAYSFLFKPQSIFLYFSIPMNFTLGDQYPYFFPTFTPYKSRLLQITTGTPDSSAIMYFVGNNFAELLINNLKTAVDQSGFYTFKYPLVDLAQVGYQFQAIPVVYLANSPVTTLLQTYVKILSANKSMFRIVMTTVTFFLTSAMGANWVLLESAQKLYAILFLSVAYSGDVELFLDLMDYSFFGWFQKLVELFFGNNLYLQSVKYDEYISQYDISRGINKGFLDYIPPRKLGKYLVRKSFIVHTMNLIVLFVLMVTMLIIITPIRYIINKKFYYKEKLCNFFNALDGFLRFKFFVRFVCMTFAPFIFYGLANLSKIQMDISLGMIAAVMTFVFLGLLAASWLQYFVYAFIMPTEVESKSLTDGFKVMMVIPFGHFMKYLKHPESSHGVGSKDGDEEEEDSKKNKKWVNEHMIIKDNSGQNQVFTLDKQDLKKGGAKIYKEEEPAVEDKDKKKVKKPGFISMQKVLEMEQKKREDIKREKEEEKENKKEAADEDEEGEKEEGDEKKEGEEEKQVDTKKEDKKEEAEGSGSSDDSNTGESSEEEMNPGDVRNVGKLLSKAVAKVERGPGICACKCIRKNKCLNKFNAILERTAKFYTLLRIAHIAVIGALSWYFGDQPGIQAIVLAASQTVFFLWTILCRPYISIGINASLIIQEFCFTGIGWIVFLLSTPSMAAMTQVLSMIMLILCVAIFVVAFFTFIVYLVLTIVQWLNSLGSKETL